MKVSAVSQRVIRGAIVIGRAFSLMIGLYSALGPASFSRDTTDDSVG